MKKTLCLLLAAVMLLSLGGCRLVDNIREVINGVAAHEEGVTDAPVTEKPGTEPAGPTDVPAAPTEDAHTPTEADAEFEAIDLEFFRSAVSIRIRRNGKHDIGILIRSCAFRRYLCRYRHYQHIYLLPLEYCR